MAAQDDQEEYMLADTKGRFAQAVKEGRPVNDVSWTPGRIVLSNRRLVLVGNDGKRTVPLSDVSKIGGRHDVSQEVKRVSNYVSLRLGEEITVRGPERDGTIAHAGQARIQGRERATSVVAVEPGHRRSTGLLPNSSHVEMIIPIEVAKRYRSVG